MKKISLLIFVALSFFPVSASAEDIKIPFEVENHIIIVKASINGSAEKFNLFVDTGGVTMLDSKVAEKLNLKRRGAMAKMDSLAFSGGEIKKIFCFVPFTDRMLDFKSFDEAYGLKIHGMIGSDLLGRYKVTLDYQKKLITLSDNFELQKGNSKAYYYKFTKHMHNHAPMIECSLNNKHTLKAMIDTGQPYPFVLPLHLYKKCESFSKKHIKAEGWIHYWPSTTLRDNYLFRINVVDMGKLELNNVLAFAAELPVPLSVPLIGKQFLEQYVTVINYPKQELLLIPVKGRKVPDNEKDFGFSVMKRDNRLIVHGVWKDSEAFKAGLKPGDEIADADGKVLTGNDLSQLWKTILTKKKIELNIKRKDETKKYKLKKALLLK